MTGTRLFFTTDIHGSEGCFYKFINAGKYYKAKVLILGGDITGKFVVPIVKQTEGSFIAEHMGSRLVLKSKDELNALEKNVRLSGAYPYITDTEEMEDLRAHKNKVQELFESLMEERVTKWVRVADERLRDTGIKCFINPGNDDSLVIDRILKESDHIIVPEGHVFYVDEQHEMISTGYSNLTPWKCPRDISEEELADKIERMASQVKNMEHCIFNFHCPPYNTTIDLAPRLDENLRPILAPGGGPEMSSTGSIAIRKAIEKYQPMLGLHGHIHESKGFTKLGRTLCINPGSEYSEGVLRGVITDFHENRFEYIFTEG